VIAEAHTTAVVAERLNGALAELSMFEKFLPTPKVPKRHVGVSFTGELVPGATRALPRRGTSDLLRAYSRSPVLQAVVRKIATGMATVQWIAKIKTPTGEEIAVPNHISERLINSGVPGLDGVQCRIFEQQSIELVGEAFGIIDRNRLGAPQIRWPIAAHWVTNVPHPMEEFFSVQPPGSAPLLIHRRDMIWHKDVDPFDPYKRGTGIARSLADELNADEAAAIHIGSSLINRARPDIIISGSKEVPLEKGDAVRLAEVWAQRFGGPHNTTKPFVSASPINVESLTPNFRELQLRGIREFERDIIISVFGVPPEIIGVITNSNRATIESAEFLFAKHVLRPRLEARRATYNEQLAWQYDDNLLIDFIDPVDENREFKLSVMNSRPEAFSIDEVRLLAGEPPLPEGQGEMVGENEDRDSGIDDSSPDPALALTPPERKGRVDKIIEDDFAEILASINEKLMVTLIESQATATIAEVGSDTLGGLNVGVDFDMDAQDVVRFISENAGSQSQLINGTTRKQLRITLAEGVANREGQVSLIERVQAVIEDATKARADMIARTETTRATGFADNQAFIQAGITEKQWLSVRDSRTRDTHFLRVEDGGLDGQKRPVGEKFISSSGDSALHPGAFATVDENANCRCVLISADSLSDKAMEDAVWQAKASQMERIEATYARQLRSVFREQGQSVIAAIEDQT